MNTENGYMITSIYHYIVIYTAVVGMGFCDALCFNLVFNVLTMSGLQRKQLQELNDELNNPTKESDLIMPIRLVNFFKMHQEMEQYVYSLHPMKLFTLF